MKNNEPSIQCKEQRRRTRWQIPKSLDLKVIIRPKQEAGDDWINPEQCWQGSLNNICELGAQITVDLVCWEQLHANQSLKLQFDASSSATQIKTEVIGQVRYAVPDEQYDRIKLGIEFSESDLNAVAKEAISRILKLSNNCSECKFDECSYL